MSEFYFDSGDAKQFLSPDVYFVGVHYAGCDNQLSRFVQKSIWTNGWLDDTPEASETNNRIKQYEVRTLNIRKGDVLVAKRLNGKGADKMTALAVGIVIGRRSESTVRVAWTLPEIKHIIPLLEVGTISVEYTLDEVSEHSDSTMRDYVEKARSKFLRLNTNIEEKLYY